MCPLFSSDVFISFPLKCCALHFRLKHETCLVVLCASYDVVIINLGSVSKQPGLKHRKPPGTREPVRAEPRGRCMLRVRPVGMGGAAARRSCLSPPLNQDVRADHGARLSSPPVVSSVTPPRSRHPKPRSVRATFFSHHFVIWHLVETRLRRRARVADMHARFFWLNVSCYVYQRRSSRMPHALPGKHQGA